MATWTRQPQKPRRKMPSFSSSLLDTIYNSTDESTDTTIKREQQQQQPPKIEDFVLHKRNNSSQIEQEIENLRRAIKIEKWMEHYNNNKTPTPRHFPSNSSSSTDSSLFSSSEAEAETESSSVSKFTTRFAKTKSRALKIYGDLKRGKKPISPGGKISNFFNSIFSPRTLKINNQGLEEWSSISKSRSMKDTTTARSCLNKNPSSKGNKSKRSVIFCPVSVNLHEEYSISPSMLNIGSKFMKKNVDNFRVYEKENDFDDKSCASSDLFELENIGRVGIGAYDEELPVYGTTSFKLNQAIAMGC